jgi:uncharacterized protein (DUF302 family)
MLVQIPRAGARSRGRLVAVTAGARYFPQPAGGIIADRKGGSKTRDRLKRSDRMTTPTAIVTISRYTYGETVDRLKNAIAAAGNTLFAQIDQSAAAENADLRLRPTTVLVFGNPKAGTPLMDAFPLAALDLPLKCVVWDDRAAVHVAYVPMRVIAERYGVTGKEGLVTAIDQALKAVVDLVCRA